MNDLHDLVSLLKQHSEWHAEVRQIVLTKDLRPVPLRLDRLFESREQALKWLGRLEQEISPCKKCINS